MKSFLLLLLGLLYQPSFAADISLFSLSDSSDPCPQLTLNLIGELIPGDAKKIAVLYNQFGIKLERSECRSLTIRVHSKGGDIDEAIAIGRKIRDHEFGVIVPNNAICYSSCVLVLAGGIDRVIVGQVGIHRPYFYSLSGNLSTSEIKQKREGIANKIREYLQTVDVSSQLLDDMLSIAPEKIKLLSENDLEKYRLSGTDATHDEKLTAKNASFYGLTSAEYRVRENIAEEKCNKKLRTSYSEYFDCRESFFYGLTIGETKRRKEKVRQMCSRHVKNINLFKDCQFKIMKHDL